MNRLYLASQSPRRAEILQKMGIAFEVRPADVDETVKGSPAACVETLAQRKAEACAEGLSDGWVLAADTLVFLNGMALGKPKDAEDAKRILRSLSGKTHQVLTGMCLLNARTGEKLLGHDGAAITFDAMTDREIAQYVATGEPLDKAGAYGIQGIGGAYITRIEGDFYATMGLSMCRVRSWLHRIGFN